jgi:hypothetical protein
VNFSFLPFPHAHPHSCSLIRSTTSPELLCLPPSAVSHLRRSSSPISYSTSTAASHCPFLTHSSSSSRARSPERRAGDLNLRHRANSNRTEVPPLLLLRQEHHQHYISTPKPLDRFPSPYCTPVAGPSSPPSEPRLAGSVSSRTAASELSFYDSNHPQVRRELLNLFSHFFLATGKPPRRILIAAARLILFKSIRDPNASLYFFLRAFL